MKLQERIAILESKVKNMQQWLYILVAITVGRTGLEGVDLIANGII